MLLEELPPEILFLICERVDFEDIAHVSRLSRCIHKVAEPILRKHRQLLRNYERLEDKIDMSSCFWHNYFLSVDSGFEGVQYVRHLIIGRAIPIWGGPGSAPALRRSLRDWNFKTHVMTWKYNQQQRESTQKTLPLEPEHQEALKQALMAEMWFDHDEYITRRLFANMSEPEVVLALLASRLPKLRTLEVGGPCRAALQFLQCVVTQAAISLAQPGSACISFRHLRSVDLTNRHQYGLAGGSLHFLSAFMALPSMQKVQARDLAHDARFERRQDLPASKVVDLTLLGMNISPQAFASLLDGGAALRSCRLQTSLDSPSFFMALNARNPTHYARRPPNFCALGTLDVLRSNAQHSLETLEMDVRLHNTQQDRPVLHSIDLTGFAKLKHASISYNCVAPDEYASAPHGEPCARLADILPPGLESLEIVNRRPSGTLVGNILHFLRYATQPRLASLKVQDQLVDWDRMELQSACRVRGIACHGNLVENPVVRTEMRPANVALSGHPSMPPMYVDRNRG